MLLVAHNHTHFDVKISRGKRLIDMPKTKTIYDKLKKKCFSIEYI